MSIADNTASLRAVLAKVKALPEAGSSEAPEPVLQEKSVTPTKAAQSVTPDTGYDGLSKVDVGAIPDEYIVPSGTKSITANGTHNVREVENVNVNVPAPAPVLQEKSVTPTKSAQNVTADSNYDGLSRVNVGAIPEEYIIPTGTKSITQNGTHDVREAESVNVNVPTPEPVLQEKTVTPDAGYDGLSKVSVNRIPADYVIPAGEKSITQNGKHDVAGYASVNVAVESDPISLQTKTVTPSETEQTVQPDTGYDGLSSVSVGAISKTYVGSGVTRQAAQTITPGTTDKTIASGQYLTGVQTIKGDANLVAGNIKKGVSIFGVDGSMETGSGGSGGSDSETCTVRLMSSGQDQSAILDYYFYQKGNGEVFGAYSYASGGFDITLTDVKCNSLLNVYMLPDLAGFYEVDTCVIDGDAELGHDLYGDFYVVGFRIGGKQGDTITINYRISDTGIGGGIP